MNEKQNQSVRLRQDPLIQRYGSEPHKANITDCAKTVRGVDHDPFHGTVEPGNEDFNSAFEFGIHEAVGGYHDAPNPGDILCAALAACLDSTIRIIAERLGVKLLYLEVTVSAHADVRGTLLVDKAVPVGFQNLSCDVNMETDQGTDSNILDKLLAAAERSCVVMQTLRSGVEVSTKIQQSGSTSDR